MTDEEKAEEYATGKAHEHYHFLFEENNGSPVDFAKLCYLDGLTEGKPKWHDLRKDPNDLPKDEEVLKEYLVAYQNFNNPNEVVVGCFTWNGVRFLENYDYSEIPYFENKNVLFAWCELPKFEE